MTEPKKQPEQGGGPKVAKEDKKLGQILLETKLITADQLAQAIADQQRLNADGKRKFKVGEVLVFKKVISMQQLHEALRSQTHKASESRNMVTDVKKKAEEQRVLYQSFKSAKAEENGQSNAFSSFISLFKKK